MGNDVPARFRARPGTHGRGSQVHHVIPEFPAFPREYGDFSLLIQQAVGAYQLHHLLVVDRVFRHESPGVWPQAGEEIEYLERQ